MYSFYCLTKRIHKHTHILFWHAVLAKLKQELLGASLVQLLPTGDCQILDCMLSRCRAETVLSDCVIVACSVGEAEAGVAGSQSGAAAAETGVQAEQQPGSAEGHCLRDC